MGFYIRKSINLGGGIRLNLSKSGLGVSAGVKGFRVGANGRGTYVHMGTGGLYYRQQFSYSRRRQTREAIVPRGLPLSDVAQRPHTNSFDLVQPIDVASSAADMDHVLRHFRSHINPTLLVGLALGLCSFWAITQTLWLGLLLLLGDILVTTLIALKFPREILVYNLEGPAEERFRELVETFDSYFSADRNWLYETLTPNFDWKRNAGASNFIKRASATASSTEDIKVKTNISIPRIRSGNTAVYLLPDVAVFREKSSVLTAVKYDNIEIQYGSSNFIEENGVRQTWKFVRKDGGPDRRFNNNRQIPICEYYHTLFVTSGGVSRTFVQSRPVDGRAFSALVRKMRDQFVTITPEAELGDRLEIKYQPANL